MLEIKNLHARVDGKTSLKGLSLTVEDGKSMLGYVLVEGSIG